MRKHIRDRKDRLVAVSHLKADPQCRIVSDRCDLLIFDVPDIGDTIPEEDLVIFQDQSRIDPSEYIEESDDGSARKKRQGISVGSKGFDAFFDKQIGHSGQKYESEDSVSDRHILSAFILFHSLSNRSVTKHRTS